VFLKAEPVYKIFCHRSKLLNKNNIFFLVNLHLTLNNYGLINDYKYKILNWIVRLNTPDQRWFVCLLSYFLSPFNNRTRGNKTLGFLKDYK
jgi:hypothetical protein